MTDQELEKIAETIVSGNFGKNAQESLILNALTQVRDAQEEKLKTAREALTKMRDCDWVITLPDRMDGVRYIAREALKKTEAGIE
jgi:hypothetical protein